MSIRTPAISVRLNVTCAFINNILIVKSYIAGVLGNYIIYNIVCITIR